LKPCGSFICKSEIVNASEASLHKAMSIVALTVGYFAIQWNRGMYLGKTPEQIVAMGRSKWINFHGKKKGQSSADMCEAETMYGDALKNLNDRALKKQSQTRRKWLLQTRTIASDFGTASHSVGYVLTGGGTMWNLQDSTIYPDVEEILADCISNKRMPAIKMKSFEVLYKELDESVACCEYLKPKSELYTPEQVAKVNKSMLELRSKQKRVNTLLETATGQDAIHLRLFVSNKLVVASGVELDE
jgi:hypothetical protein